MLGNGELIRRLIREWEATTMGCRTCGAVATEATRVPLAWCVAAPTDHETMRRSLHA